MKFGLSLPLAQIEPKGEFTSFAAVTAIGRAMEQAGVFAACISEHPAPSAHWLHNDPTGHDCLDPMVSLAFVAAATTSLHVYTNIVVLPYRNPFLTAKAAATLQVLSGNRFILGVGVGYQKVEFDALGVEYRERGALMDEALETIDQAWSGGAVVKQGRHFNAIGNEPRPIPSPRPPIWVGGASDKAVERAARWGDGWLPYFSVPTNDPTVLESSIVSVVHFAGKLRQLHELREQFGRRGSFDVATGSPFRPKSASKIDAEQFIEATRQVEAAGATCSWTPLPAPSLAAYLENIAWFGAEVIAPYGGS